MFLDLDNTVLDRTGAFRGWAERFLDGIGAPSPDLDWLMSVDADGLTDRWDVADQIRDRYRLTASSVDLVDEMREGVVANSRLDPLVACALRIADDAGWVPVLVTNGATRQEDSTIRRTGLDSRQPLADSVHVHAPGHEKAHVMPSRRRDPERGSSLILAVAMITIISVAIVAVLGYAATSFRTVTTIREQRDRAYAADGAVETAIASLRKLADEGAVGSDDPDGPLLPCTGLDYAAVGKAPTVTVSCEVVGARGPGIPGDTMPPYTLWSVGGNIDAGGTTLYVGGPVSSSGSINVGTLDASGYIVQSAGGCSGTIVVLDPDDNQCGAASAPDPSYPSRALPDTGDLDNFNPPPDCEAGARSSGPASTPKRACSRSPTTEAVPTGSSTSAPACITSTSGSPTTITCGTWGTPRSWAANRRAGTPTAERRRSAPLGGEEGAACQTEKDSLTAEGIQWVLGGASQIDATGATVELCAKASAPESGDQQISVYSQLTGETASPESTGFEPSDARGITGAPWTPDPPSPAFRIDPPPPPPSFAQATIQRTPVADRETSITLAGFGLSPIPRGSRINSVTLRVSHRELVAATPPPNPADLAKLKLQLTNGLGEPCTVQDLTPNFTSDAKCTVRRARLRHDGVPEHDSQARWRIRGLRGDVARRRGCATSVGAARRHADRRELHAADGPPARRRRPDVQYRLGRQLCNWGTFYAHRHARANGPVQFRRGAIAQSIDASGIPEGDKTRAFCLGYGPKCKQGPSRTLRYTANTGGGPPKLVALNQYFDAPTVGQGVRVWSWNVGRSGT